MNNVILHTEYLLRHHDCVVLPGLGAFVSRRMPARFDKENPDVMLPPCRRLTFNSELRETDGLVASSISRRDGISYAEADRIVSAGVSDIAAQLEHEGELLFGHLGAFMKLPGTPVRFYPAARTVNSQYYGLGPLRLRALSRGWAADSRAAELPPVPVVARPAETAVTPETAETERDTRVRRTWLRNIGAAAALLAIAITVSLFVMNPIRMANEPEQASIAPVIDRTAVTLAPAASKDADIVVGDENVPAGVSVQAEQIPVAPAHTEPGTLAEATSAGENGVNSVSAKPAAPEKRFENSDPYVVVVASFPTAAQARQYMLDHSGRRLDILEQDGKYRVYCSTASSYADARRLTASAGVSDAWVCRR